MFGIERIEKELCAFQKPEDMEIFLTHSFVSCFFFRGEGTE